MIAVVLISSLLLSPGTLHEQHGLKPKLVWPHRAPELQLWGLCVLLPVLFLRSCLATFPIDPDVNSQA